jgi:uncharacterized membrane protein
MKKSLEISAQKIAVIMVCWLGLANILVGAVQVTQWWPFTCLLFICLSFLPGVALLRTFHVVLKNYSAGVLFSFGLSILVLMLSGLIANQVLPLVGVTRPLEFWGALGAWNVVTILIITSAIITNHHGVRVKRLDPSKWPAPAWLLLVLCTLAPCLAVLGAFQLNNGGDAVIAGTTLCYIGALVIYAFLLRRRLPDGLLAWFIFSIGLAILLMTSMRGWDIVGHDIEREFRVYSLTHMHGVWNIALDRDPYNACLSITILPEMLSRLLDISGLMVFKVILQVIFAACPAVVYIMLRHYVPKLGALIGCLLFISYPTFINDSAMLTRQGIAYLFFALALLIMTTKLQNTRFKIMFLLCALGSVLSHYSTAYMFVALFGVAVICKLGFSWWCARRHHPLSRSAKRTILSPLFAVILFLMTFTWYTQITETSSGLGVTLRNSLANIPTIFSSDNKSADTSASLMFAGGKTQVDLYESYLAGSQQTHAGNVATDALQYMPVLTSDELPLTQLGERARAIGINPAMIASLRHEFAKVLQLLSLAGVAYAAYILFRRKHEHLGPDVTCLGVAGIILLGMLVVLPVLSINYGVLRAFQQSLIFLLVPMILFLATASRHVWPWARTAFATSGIVFLLLLFTGLFTQLLGGASPSLSLNNKGLYYGLYYPSYADTRSFRWLKEHVPSGSDVRAANFNRAYMHDPDYPFSRSGILPSQTGASTYVYLDSVQIVAQKIYTYHESSPLIMTFPLDYYEATKNQIYSTSSTSVYR